MPETVSVVIPAYNCADFLPDSIDSVLHQTVPPTEIIVVDDGSTDGTKDVCGRYPGVTYLYQENQGAAVARNLGWRHATGEFLLFLDGDDLLLPTAVETGLAVIRPRPEVGFVFGRYDFYALQPDGSYQVEARYEDQPEEATYGTLLAARHKIQCGCILFRRSAVEAVGGFNPALRVMQDIHFFLLVAQRFPIYFHQTVVSHYRYTGNNISHNSARMLVGAHQAHGLQEDFVRKSGDPDWQAAYEAGLGSWTKLFGDRLPYEALRYLQTGEWAKAWGSLELVRHYDPALKWVHKEIFENTWNLLLSHLRSRDLDDDWAYWKKDLAGLPPLFALPTYRPRPVVPSFHRGTRPFRISQDLAARLLTGVQVPGAGLRDILLTAFQVLLFRYAGTEDVAVGVPVSVGQGTERWVNGLVIRSDLSGNPGFAGLVDQVAQKTREARAHGNLPFCLLADELVHSPDPSHAPVVQVTFGYEDLGTLRTPDLADLTVSAWLPGGPYDLSLYLRPEAGGFDGLWSYNPDLFDPDTIGRLDGHFQILLGGVAAAPQGTVGTFPLLTDGERLQLLTDWNRTPRNLGPGKVVHQLVADQAARTPDQVAVVFGPRILTYGDLDRKSNQLARFLQSARVQPDQMVGLYVERSLEMVIGLLGILKSGASYVPIDPGFPADRIEYMLENAESQVLVTQQSLVPRWEMPGTRVICLDSDWPQVAQEPETAPRSDVTSGNVAYVIYTSGSTGKPKGVQVLHQGVVNFLLSMAKAPGVGPGDVLLSLTTLSFDIAVLEIFLPLTVGARVIIVPKEASMDGKALGRILKDSGVTLMQATPATWRLLLESGWEGQDTLRMVCGGEALPKDLAVDLLAKGSELWNLYGPTETTVWSTGCQVTSSTGRITIGRPIDDTQIYILDPFLQPVPVGVPGELHIGGIGVARGYWKRPELTAEKFIPNPFPGTGSDRIYKTGDLARYLPDGRIECLGRLDFQVKIRGFRIELGEIESVLATHGDLSQAVVVVREDTPGDKRLVSYLIPNEGVSIDAVELRSFLKKSIPEYMVPSTFVVLESFPLTPNGKVDRKALPVPSTSGQPEEISGQIRILGKDPRTERLRQAAPLNDFELQLVRIWEKVLHVSPIGMEDGFFELGGHSLLAVSLLREIGTTFQKDLPLPVLFRAPTVRQLAKVLLDTGIEVHPQPLVVLQEGANRPALFCIYGIYLYYALARNLGRDQPVYGIYIQEEVDALGGDSPKTRLMTVAELTDRYLETIRKKQPHGPYYLAGESLGGLIALEIAQKLHLAGETVALISLFDSGIPGEKGRSLGKRIKGQLDRFSKGGLRQMFQKLRTSQAQAESGPLSDEEITRRKFIHHAFQGYRPHPYQGKALVFRAKEEEHFDSLIRWNRYLLGDLEFCDVPGDHLSILQEPNVKVMADFLRSQIDKTLKP